MRTITYAGEAVHTSDEVASLVVELGAELAKAGRAEAIEIPIVIGGGGRETAELVVGVGNDVLSLPYVADDQGAGSNGDPDFADAVEMLTAMIDAVVVQFTAPTEGSSALAPLSIDTAIDAALEAELDADLDAAPAADPAAAPVQSAPAEPTDADGAQVTSLDDFRRSHRSHRAR